MNPESLLLFFGRGQTLQTVTFNVNTTWPAPAGVNLLTSVVGHGQNGTASTGAHNYVAYYDSYSQRIYHYTDGHTEAAAEVYDGRTLGSSHPANHCNAPVIATGVPGLESYADCFRYVDLTIDEGNYVAGTTGANATGFGYTFDGGTPTTPIAVTTTYNNVAVTPLANYPIVVPSGATIQITYFA